eukprot:3766154-Pyramimonas_sp.AAC.1
MEDFHLPPRLGTFRGMLVLLLLVFAPYATRAQINEDQTTTDSEELPTSVFQGQRQTLNHCVPNSGLGTKGAIVACKVNPNSPEHGELYARSTSSSRCFNQYATPEDRPSDERHAVRCFNPSYNLGYSPRGYMCAGTYAQAVVACARLSVSHHPAAPNDTEYPITEWRLAHNDAEVGELCGSGCNADGVPMWVDFGAISRPDTNTSHNAGVFHGRNCRRPTIHAHVISIL